MPPPWVVAKKAGPREEGKTNAEADKKTKQLQRQFEAQAKEIKELKARRVEQAPAEEPGKEEQQQPDIAAMQKSFADMVRHIGEEDAATKAFKERLDRAKKEKDEAKPIHRQLGELQSKIKGKDTSLAAQDASIKKAEEEEKTIKEKIEGLRERRKRTAEETNELQEQLAKLRAKQLEESGSAVVPQTRSPGPEEALLRMDRWIGEQHKAFAAFIAFKAALGDEWPKDGGPEDFAVPTDEADEMELDEWIASVGSGGAGNGGATGGGAGPPDFEQLRGIFRAPARKRNLQKDGDAPRNQRQKQEG